MTRKPSQDLPGEGHANQGVSKYKLLFLSLQGGKYSLESGNDDCLSLLDEKLYFLQIRTLKVTTQKIVER